MIEHRVENISLTERTLFMRAISLGRKNLLAFFGEKGEYNTLLINVIYFLCGTVVSRGAVFGSFAPFGVAFCAAVPYSNAFFGSIGSIVGYILLYPQGSFRYAAAVITVYAIRWLLNDIEKIRDSIVFAPLAAMTPLLCTGIVIILVTGRGFEDFVMCLCEASLAAVGAYFFSRSILLASGSKGISTYDQQEIACIVMSSCIFLLAANSLTFSGISLGRILAVTAVLFCAYYGSVAGGCIGGTATGIVFSIGSENFGFIAAGYGFGGLMAGLFSYAGKLWVCASFALCSGICSLQNGLTKESASFLYETIIACVLFMLIPKEIGNKIASYISTHTDTSESEGLRRSVIMRLDFASKALKGISDTVNAVALKLKDYYAEDIDSVYTQCIEANCKRCGMRAFCWQSDAERKEDRFAPITSLLNNSSEITGENIKKLVNGKCCKSNEMARTINDRYESYMNFITAESRVSQIRGVVAGQLCGLGDILADMKSEFENYESYDLGASERVCAYLKANGFVPVECSARLDRFGRMEVELETADTGKKIVKRPNIVKEISKACGRELETPQVTSIGGRSRAVFSEKPKFDIQVGSAQHNCGGGTLCGDSFNYFNDGQGRFVSVISDGMGTGGRATVDAGLAVSVMTKLIRAGLSFDCALNVANSALMVKSEDESISTVDIVSIDLFSGITEIMKAGAPITFVRKNGRIHRVEPTSLPAGILSSVKLTHDMIELSHGDIVVMVSDGAVAISDSWIGEMMRAYEGADIQELVNDIIDEATIGSKLCRDDDITVIGMRVMEN